MQNTRILSEITDPVQEDLAIVYGFMQEHLCSHIPMINHISHYIIDNKGKRLRPLLVMLCDKSKDYQGSQHIHLAAIIEFIHTATLLHDDVIDHAEKRRHRKTAHMIWGNTASVLAGDFLHSRAFQLITKLNQPLIMDALANAANHIVEGEMLQLLHLGQAHTKESEYFTIIHQKTAELFCVAAYCTALLQPQKSELQKYFKAFGYHFGMAYQLIDDLLDYQPQIKTGKKCGNDLAEGKPTLPFIYAFQKASLADANMMQKALKQGDLSPLASIISLMHQSGAFDYTFQKAKQHIQQARELLQHIPPSIYRNGLLDLGDFVLSRYRP